MVEDAIAFLADGFHMLLHNFIYTQNWLLNLLKYLFLFNVKIKVFLRCYGRCYGRRSRPFPLTVACLSCNIIWLDTIRYFLIYFF